MSLNNNYRHMLKKIFGLFGLSATSVIERFGKWSLNVALRRKGELAFIDRLRQIVPDVSAQESRQVKHSAYIEIKRRGLQAFQCELMLGVVRALGKKNVTVVDIGDSAGTHMLYLKALVKNASVETISVNLDPRAIDKIKSRGLRAIQCRAEEVLTHLPHSEVDIFTAFEMVEHLHNPTVFFHRLAKRIPYGKMIVTVPYVKQSRVGMQHIRLGKKEEQYAEDVHVFELCPQDWTLLLRHAGWRVFQQSVYYQYPTRWPFVSRLLAQIWKTYDYEGFWGVVLERDLTYAELYKDWDE